MNNNYSLRQSEIAPESFAFSFLLLCIGSYTEPRTLAFFWPLCLVNPAPHQSNKKWFQSTFT